MDDTNLNDPTAGLIGRERIKSASRMIPEGTEVSAVTAEQIAGVAADVESFRRAYKISRKDIAVAVGYSPGVISEFISGKYAGSGAQVAIDLDSWLVEEEQRRSRPATTQFVWTAVAQHIKAVAHYCLDKRNIGMVYGPDTAGIGKTTALQAIYEELGPRRCTLVTIDKVDANPTGLFKKILQAMGKDDKGSNSQRSYRIVEALRGRSHLLLVDQAHNLRWAKNDKPFYHLADLHDATKTAQLWCGTADLVLYLERQLTRNSDESLAQINSRIFPRVDLMDSIRAGGRGEPLATIQQVREMFAKNKLRLTDAAARFICRICNQPDSGCLRLAVKIVEYATMLCEMRNPPPTAIDVDVLQEALRRGISTRRTDLLLGGMDIETPAVIAKAG